MATGNPSVSLYLSRQQRKSLLQVVVCGPLEFNAGSLQNALVVPGHLEPPRTEPRPLKQLPPIRHWGLLRADDRPQPPPSTAGLAGKVPAELLTIPTQRPRIGPPRPDIELMSTASPSIIPTDHTEALNMRTGPMSNPGELVPEICPLFAGTTNPGVTSQTADTPTISHI